jgi:glycine/sarcosine N-methyltransferase
MYDEFASDYDRFVNWENRLSVEIPFIEKVLNSIPTVPGQPKRVLDAACGTGMHTLALSRSGYEISGADLSEPMIVKARANAAAAGEKIRFAAAGFGSLANVFGRDQFDALLCLGNSLPHLLSADKLHTALIDFAACLKHGGILLIQNRNFDSVMAKKERWMEPQTFNDQENEWVFQRFYDFEPGGLIQFNIVTLKRPLKSVWTPGITSTRLRPQLHQELQDDLCAAGFHDLQSFGSMTTEPFDPLNSGNLVLTGIRK